MTDELLERIALAVEYLATRENKIECQRWSNTYQPPDESSKDQAARYASYPGRTFGPRVELDADSPAGKKD